MRRLLSALLDRLAAACVRIDDALVFDREEDE